MKKSIYLKSLLSLLLLFVGMNAFATEYELVTSTSQLEAGKTYLIGTSETGSAYFIGTTSNANNRKLSASATITNSKVTLADDMLKLTLGGSEGAWTFKTVNYAGTAGYLNATNTTGSNYLKVVATLDDYAYFTVSFSSDAAVITCTGKTSRNIVRYNSSSSCISCYSSGQAAVYLFKEVEDASDTRTATTTSFPANAYSAYIGETFASPVATVDNGGAVTYSSSATDVATVNASTGEVALVGVGTTTIKASYAGDTSYKESSASYTLTVGKAYASLAALVADGAPTTTGIPVKVTLTDETIQSIALNSAGTSRMGIMLKSGDQDVEIYCYGVPTEWEANGTVSGTVTGTWKLFSSTWELCPADWTELTYTAPAMTNPTITLGTYKTSMAVGDADDEYTVTTNSDGALSVTSSDENVAEAIVVDNTVLVSAKAAGTTTITVKVAATANYYEASKSYTLTVTEAATLPFSFDGGKADISTTKGMSQTGLGSDYSASPKLKFDNTSDNLVINYSSAATALEYTIKGNSFSGGTFDVMESADGTEYTSVKSYTELGDAAIECASLKSDSRYVKFVYTKKSTGNVALGAIKITNVSNASITVSNAGYATFVTPVALNFDGLDITAYTATKKTSTVHLDPVTAVPANSAIVVKANEGTYTVPAYTGEISSFTTDLTYSATDVTADGTQYILAKVGEEVGFHKATADTTIAAGKGYIVITSGAKSFYPFEDEATQIEAVESINANDAIYNLAGQRIAQPQKGINIINGKKVVIK